MSVLPPPANPLPASPQPTRFWPTLETIPGPSAVPVIWRARLGPQYALLKPAFLKPDPAHPAQSLPCPLWCGCWHQVVQRQDSSLAAVCTCGSQCGPYILTRDDITPLVLDWPNLARALCSALDLQPKTTRLDPFNTFQIGCWSADAIPVILTVQFTQAEFLHVVSALVTRLAHPFILLAPTHRHLDQAATQLLTTAGAAFFPLEPYVTLNPQFTQAASPDSTPLLIPLTPPAQLFAQFTPALPVPDDQDRARRAFALVQNLSAGDRSKPPTIPTVFRLYCIEELSIPQIARKCRCSIATVANRLRLIRDQTGLDPLDLRQFAAQFATFSRDFTAARRNYSRRHPLPAFPSEEFDRLGDPYPDSDPEDTEDIEDSQDTDPDDPEE